MSWQRKFIDSFSILKDILLDFLRIEHSYIMGLIITLILGVLFQSMGCWYLMLLSGGIAGFLMKRSGLWSFVLGFLGTALIWGGFFVYFLIIGPLTEFTALVASVLGMFESFPNILILITIIIGGLLGGLGALNGTYIANIIYSFSPSNKELKLKDKKLNK